MQNILVAIDFSTNSDTAMRYAWHLVAPFARKFVLFHAIEAGHQTHAAHNELEARQKSLQVLNPNNIELKTLVHKKPLTEGLLEVLQDEQIDAVFVGMRGLTTIEEILIGSSAVKILNEVEQPIFVIPPKMVFKEIDKILFANDLSKKYTQNNLTSMMLVARQYAATVRLVNVRLRGEAVDAEEEEINRKRLANYFEIEQVSYAFKTVVSESVIEGLLYYIGYKGDHDMLVMVTHKRNWFEKLFGISYSNQLATQAVMPMLILKE
jgi:nucleotide-binding universal stress UspA family protein